MGALAGRLERGLVAHLMTAGSSTTTASSPAIECLHLLVVYLLLWLFSFGTGVTFKCFATCRPA